MTDSACYGYSRYVWYVQIDANPPLASQILDFEMTVLDRYPHTHISQATFAVGCFWCLELAFRSIQTDYDCFCRCLGGDIAATESILFLSRPISNCEIQTIRIIVEPRLQ